MTSAAWLPVDNGGIATWDKNKSRADLERTAPLYNDPTITYNSSVVFYDGYDPSLYSPEGETGAVWAKVAE